MLQAFGFQRFGVLISDLYFVDPRPLPGQESAERGVRLEVRMLAPGKLQGNIYSARPIEVGAPVWRVDLLESADGPPGSLNRAHHHPAFRGWNPGPRVFDAELSADPVNWVGARLADLDGLLEQAGIERDEVTTADAQSLHDCLPDVLAAVTRLLAGVRAGELAVPPDGAQPQFARLSWL